MKYFAKYMAVEGEIVDYFIQPTGELGLMYDGLKEFPGMAEYLTKCKPAKLFLCSRDIQDEDWSVNGRIHLYFEPKNENERHPFKVVGPISPQALWVKEGDEFGEEELEFDVRSDDQSRPIKIKGPCGHFH